MKKIPCWNAFLFKSYRLLCTITGFHLGDGTKFRVNEKEHLGPEANNDFKNNKQFNAVPFITEKPNRFMPINNSPLIDKGLMIKRITDGYKGNAPDWGAYEWGEDPLGSRAELDA